MSYTDEEVAELTRLNKEADFPAVLQVQDGYSFPEDPWERLTQKRQWIDENIERFLFTLERMLTDAPPYFPYGAGPNTAGIYFLIKDYQITYVGKATNIADRLASHRRSEAKAWNRYWCITGVPHRAMDDIENMYIEWLEPMHNHKRIGCCDKGMELIRKIPNQWSDWEERK